CATERPSDCLFSIAAASNGVGLCFTHGASLPDPKKILVGSGKQTRFLRLQSSAVLDRPEVKALFSVAAAQAKTSMPTTGRGNLIIRSVSASSDHGGKMPNEITSLDAAMAFWFHVVAHSRGASELIRSAKRQPRQKQPQ